MENKPKRSIKVTIEHEGDIGDYESPTIAFKSQEIVPFDCACSCTEKSGSGGGHGKHTAA